KPPGKTEPRPSDGHPINNTPPATLDQEELVSAVTEAVLQRLPTSATIDQASLKELVDQVAEERKQAEATKRLEAQLAKDAKFRGEFMGRLKDNLLKVATDAAIRDADLPQIQAILTRRYDETLRIYGGGNKQDP